MRKHLRTDESGMALMTVMLVSMLACALMAGLFAALAADQRSLGFDRDQSQAYAAAHAGLEKLTTQLAQLFETDFSPSAAQITAASATAPDISGFSFTAPGGGSGYKVDFIADDCEGCPNEGNPLPSENNDITTGPFAGLKGVITPYTLTVTARSAGGGSEVRLRREVQTVAVPVFQFGVFGERSLSFHSGSNMEFAGRVHTNGHLFLAANNGFTTTFRDKLTAVGEVVRAEFENETPLSESGYTGSVKIPTVIGSTYRSLAATEGSVAGGPGSSPVSGWKNLSEATYNTNIRNTMTGAKRLDLPLVRQGAQPIDLIRRPRINSNEDTANPPVFGQRYFSQASLRILLSDRASDITDLPTVTATAPIQLTGDWLAAPPVGYTVGANRPPLASAIGPASTTISGSSSTYGSSYHQLNVVAVPSTMLIPELTVSGVAGAVTCTGKTHNQFTGCNLPSGVPSGRTITAVHPTGVTVSAVSTGAAVANTINVAANATLPFNHNFAWINDRSNNRPTPMTCEGYNTAVNPDKLINCRILGVTNAQTTSGRAISTHSLVPADTSLIGGFIKIEKQDADGDWSDVTLEILNLGFAAPNQEGTICGDPTPDAVIRFQRLRDNGGACTYAGSIDSRDYWPQVLFDAREATYRDQGASAPMTMGGVMNYIAIDIENLKQWFNGEIGTTGNQALNNNGYIVYFSDRRGNHNDAVTGAPETGEYGNENSVNSPAGAGTLSNGITEVFAPSATLDGGEDRNENGTLETYGATPSTVVGVIPSGSPGGNVSFGTGSNPLTPVPNHPEARVNKQIFFRRALKLINGGINSGVNNLPESGLTVASENGVYVQGNYNATTTDEEAEPNRPAAIIADSLVILSNNWKDVNSLNSPNDRAGRDATQTGYRFGMVAGKSIPFKKPGWASLANWGTDGGVHNFMRMLENWDGVIAHYRGSMVSLYTARQFIGMFKNNSNVYFQPERDFSFDTDFLNPFLLPPGTPMFRDVNTLRFRQILRPNQ